MALQPEFHMGGEAHPSCAAYHSGNPPERWKIIKAGIASATPFPGGGKFFPFASAFFIAIFLGFLSLGLYFMAARGS